MTLQIGDKVKFIQEYRNLNDNALLALRGETAVIVKEDAGKGRKYALDKDGKEIHVFKRAAHHYLKKI